MAKKYCISCGEELSWLDTKAELSDGWVCGGCLEFAGLPLLQSRPDSQTVKGWLKDRQLLQKDFSMTSKATSLQVDDEHRLFKIKWCIYRFSELLSFELLEDGDTVSKGGLGRAVIGGLLFGEVGAMVGGITGAKRTKKICNSMRIKLTFRSPAPPEPVYLDFITTDTKVGGIMYQGAQAQAQKCLSVLQRITDIAQQEAVPVAVGSAADEILKFKNLLDMGIITQEEFEVKKKQLLGL